MDDDGALDLLFNHGAEAFNELAPEAKQHLVRHLRLFLDKVALREVARQTQVAHMRARVSEMREVTAQLEAAHAEGRAIKAEHAAGGPR
jgi:hypothetical protein